MEKKRLKFNFVDVIIILLVAVAFVVGYNMINNNVTAPDDAPEVYFTVEVRAVPETYKDMFAKGDIVNDAIKGDVFGEIVDIKTAPTTDIGVDGEKGEFVISEYEGVENVYITIKGTPTSVDTDIIIAQQEIKVGNMVYFKKPGCVGSGYVVEMDIKEAKSK